MEKYAIWKNHKVIGYIELTEKQKEQLNGIHGINVYFGFDRVTNPERYINHDKETEERINKEIDTCGMAYKIRDKEGNVFIFSSGGEFPEYRTHGGRTCILTLHGYEVLEKYCKL